METQKNELAHDQPEAKHTAASACLYEYSFFVPMGGHKMCVVQALFFSVPRSGAFLTHHLILFDFYYLIPSPFSLLLISPSGTSSLFELLFSPKKYSTKITQFFGNPLLSHIFRLVKPFNPAHLLPRPPSP